VLTIPRSSHTWDEALLNVNNEHVFYRSADDPPFRSDHGYDVDGHFAHVDGCTGYFAQDTPHNGYVSLSDIEFDDTLSHPPTATQPPQPVFDGQYGGDVQVGNGLTIFCSPHGVSTGYDAAEEYMYTDVPGFDFDMQGVEFAHADTMEQPDAHLRILTSPNEPCQMRPNLSACQHRVQIVRRWLSDHASRPYPNLTEKAALAASAGGSEHQLNVCFRNLRAREKHRKLVRHVPITPLIMHLVFEGNFNIRDGSGSTDTGLRADMSPQSSYAQPGFVSCADEPPATNTSDSSPWPSSSDSGYPMSDHNQDAETQVFQSSEAELAHQVPFSVSAPKRKGRRYHAQRQRHGTSEHLSCATQDTTSSSSLQELDKRFPCTVCVKAFKDASGWKRHEASVHGYNDREWICVLTDAFKLQAECVFCLEPMDSIDHLDKHAIDPCSHKCTAERSFPRKDLLKQHVLLAHLADAPASIKKRFEVPKEWSRGLEVSPGGPGSRWCGFCRCMLETTAKRMDHVAQHFRKGQNMTSWIRM